MLTRRRLDRRHLRHVVRNDQAGDGALVACAIRTARSTRWRICSGDGGHLDVLVRDVLEQRRQVHLLLVRAAERRRRLLSDDRDHGLVVELRVIQPVQEVNRARAGGREAHTDLARELRMRAGHERCHLLVAHLNQLWIAPGTIQRPEDRIDPVPRIPVDAMNAPLAEPSEQKVSGIFGHAPFFSRRPKPSRLIDSTQGFPTDSSP